MNDYRVILLDLPTTVRGYVLRTLDGFCTIVLNSKLNIYQNKKTFKHEIEHIINNDFDSKKSIDAIESERHRR